jgi:hypothetical protein
MRLLGFTACYHRLLLLRSLFIRQPFVDSLGLPPCRDDQCTFSRQEIYLKIILISTFCIAKCLGGKYQKHFAPANTICKFVNQFSFVEAAPNETAQLSPLRSGINL